MGEFLAFLGIALAAGVAGMGSIFGVAIAGRTATGVLSEKPKMFGSLVVLVALPGTQGMYGFLMAVLLLTKVGVIGGTAPTTTAEGLAYLAAAAPTAISGLFSGIFQGKVAASAISMVAKQPKAVTNGIMLTSLVEIYAILGLLTSILLFMGL